MQSNMPTLIVLAIIIAASCLAILRIKKKGGCSCGNSCDCKSCPSSKQLENSIDLNAKKQK